MRVFVAIDLPEPVLDVLEAVQDDLPVGRHMARETLHLTLAFLGDQDDSLEALHDELGTLGSAPFDLRLQGVGIFGGRQPRALWAGVGEQPRLSALRARVRGSARRAGIALPRERFRPHVTLARFGQRLRAEEVAKIGMFMERNGGFGTDPFGVTEVTLFQSVLHRDGAVHEALATYPLG